MEKWWGNNKEKKGLSLGSAIGLIIVGVVSWNNFHNSHRPTSTNTASSANSTLSSYLRTANAAPSNVSPTAVTNSVTPTNSIVGNTPPPSASSQSSVAQQTGMQFSNFTWKSNFLTFTVKNVSNQIQTVFASNFVIKASGVNSIQSDQNGQGAYFSEPNGAVINAPSVDLMPGDQLTWTGMFTEDGTMPSNFSISGYTVYYMLNEVTPIALYTFP